MVRTVLFDLSTHNLKDEAVIIIAMNSRTMVADWELDGSDASSIISSEASSSTEGGSDAYFNDPGMKTNAITATENDDSLLRSEFEMKASTSLNGIDSDQIISSPVPPPPPSEDSSFGSDNEDDDLSSLKDHIMTAARNQKEGFGDETVDVLNDAEDRLNTVPSPPHSSVSLSIKKRDSESLSQSNDEQTNAALNVNDDDISELSDGAASLLRGPIMAAKSFAQIQQENKMQHLDNIMNQNTPSKVRAAPPVASKEEEPKTPSATRREFISSAQKTEPWSPWSMQQQERKHQESSTSSAARVKFMSSTQKEQKGSEFAITPSTSRRDFIHSAQKLDTTTQPWSPWSAQQQNVPLQESDTPSASKFLPSAQKANSSPSHYTPSTDRSGFVSSSEKAKWSSVSSSSSTSSSIAYPSKVERRESAASPNLDSVSSLEANSPSAFVQPTTKYQIQTRGDSQQQITPPNVTFESSVATPSSLVEVKKKSPVAEEAEAFLEMNKHILHGQKSLDNIIELGERQMKMGAAVSISNRNSDRDATTAKKPFLRKGTRKEPSALQTRGRLNSTTTNTATPDATTESASERKARLEQLEKMQLDLMQDLERRKSVKEEARERRRERNEIVAEKRSLVKNRRITSNATASATKSPNRTPLQSSRASISASSEQTPSQVRQKTATKQTRSVESKVELSSRDRSVSPAPIVEGKSLQGTNGNKKAKTNDNEAGKKKSPVQTRARSTPRRSNNNNNNKSNEKSSDLDVKVAEDMKKKEEEQMALIKNMRRRQEVALREAEGERERAKAWAAAERESVKKWADEQRALIRKDRHKAANAALLAARKVSRGKQDEDANEEGALSAELEEMRLEMKKLKVEAEEAQKLRDKVRKQERMINTLKRGGDTATNSSTRKIENGGKSRAVLGDRTSKENTQQRPKTAAGKNAVHSANKQSATKERTAHEPTDSENNLVDDQAIPQKKPYNAADYAGTKSGVQTHAIPQFVSAPTPPGHGGRASQIVTYQNGTTKEILPDGTTTISFANGDRKRTYANEKKGIEVYYYAATKTTQVTHQDGSNSFHFPNKQIEHHYGDGRKEITFPDGTKQMVFPDGTRDTTFPDAMRLIDYPDGNQRVVTSS